MLQSEFLNVQSSSRTHTQATLFGNTALNATAPAHHYERLPNARPAPPCASRNPLDPAWVRSRDSCPGGMLAQSAAGSGPAPVTGAGERGEQTRRKQWVMIFNIPFWKIPAKLPIHVGIDSCHEIHVVKFLNTPFIVAVQVGSGVRHTYKCCMTT